MKELLYYQPLYHNLIFRCDFQQVNARLQITDIQLSGRAGDGKGFYQFTFGGEEGSF